MNFTLTISLDNAEAEEMGPGPALAGYLNTIAQLALQGRDHPGSWRVRDGNGNTIGQYAITGDGGPDARQQAVDGILGMVRGEVFRSEAGGLIILTAGDTYAISVDEGGHTVSAYLITVPPAEIAAALDASEGDIAGWATGYDI